MAAASEKKREVLDFFKVNEEKLSGDAELLRSAKELGGLFGKVIRGYKLYPRSNPAFARFADQFKQKLDQILKDIPSISLRISTKGFMMGRTVLDTSEKDREIVFFLYNDGLREIFFQQGTTREEISELFNVLAQCTLFANEDYDLATLLWDHNFPNIGYITEDELIKENLISMNEETSFSPFMVEELSYNDGFDGIGEDEDESGDGSGGDNPNESATGSQFEKNEFEKYSALIFKESDDIDINERRDQLNKRIGDHSVGKMEMFKFEEALKKNSDGFVVNRFLRELSSRLMTSQGTSEGIELLETAASLWEKLLLFGSVRGAILFIKTLKMIAERLENDHPDYSEKIREGFASLSDTEFLDDVFGTLEDLPKEELSAAGELLQMIPPSRIEYVISRINGIESTDVRITLLESFAQFIEISDELLALTRHEDWKVVRNVFALMKNKKDQRIIPAIRNALSHPQKQARIEALALLMEFSIEEAMPALEKAVFSSEREIRSIAVRKVLELNEPRVKSIVNRALQVHNLNKLDSDEIDEYLKLLIDLRKEDMYDLLGNLLFTDDSKIKNKAVTVLYNAPTLTPFAKFIARACDIPLLSKMKSDDLKHFCKLFKPETHSTVLPALEPLFFERGGLFNNTMKDVKEIVFKSLVIYIDEKTISDFFRKGLSNGNRETIALINKIAAKFL